METAFVGEGLVKPQTLDEGWRIHPAAVPWESAAPPAEDDPGWQPIAVPGAWEAHGLPTTAEGPFWYRCIFPWRPEEASRVFLRLRGVSTRCRVYLNGCMLGEHEGIWDGCEKEVTRHLVPGGNALAVLVQKAGDTLPLRQAVAGFLPDVCVLFGGIWRPVELVRRGCLALQAVRLEADADRARLTVAVQGETQPGAIRPHLHLCLTAPDGREAACLAQDLPARPGPFTAALSVTLPHVEKWDLDAPSLYTARIAAYDDDGLSDQAIRRFGWRTFARQGCRILLNGRPLMLRGLLHWGWYPETVAPTPARDQIRRELIAAKEAGFNLIKHCLYVPVEDYYDLADELGVLIWQELPLWLPEVTPALKEKVRRQYPAIMARLNHHPSLVFWTLGCELGATADADFLGDLYLMAHAQAGEALVCENSGSGECYGGFLNEHTDFHDYHFYTDPHYYRPLMDRFAADWRETKPWLFGEFCDQDTIRDIERLREENGGRDPWWLTPPAVADLTRENPGYREEHDRLRAVGLLGVAYDGLLRASRRKDLAYRKTVLETVRQYDRLAGYVLTSLRDTPLSTSAFFDDFGWTKHEPAAWRRFNGDTLLGLAWDNHREWVHGGDQARAWDTFNYLAGQTIRAHLVLSHYGPSVLRCERAVWRLTAGAAVLAAGAIPLACDVTPGTMGELAVVEFAAPETPEITPCMLAVELTGRADGDEAVSANAWPLWIYAPTELELAEGAVLHDPCGRLPGAPLSPMHVLPDPGAGTVLVATAWEPGFRDWLADGGRLLYIQPEQGLMPTVAGSFWREAVQVFADEEIFRGFAEEGYCGLQWYSLAADRMLVIEELTRFFNGRAQLRPLLRRLDTRRYDLSEYAVEVRLGRGRAIQTTLRLAGGLGDQASDMSRTVAGRALLARFVHVLARD